MATRRSRPPEEPAPQAVTIRRAPKYGAFILLGALLGVAAAVLLTFLFPENERYSRSQVLGYLLVFGAAAGIGLGGITAWVVDRLLSRRGPAAASAVRLPAEGADSGRG